MQATDFFILLQLYQVSRTVVENIPETVPFFPWSMLCGTCPRYLCKQLLLVPWPYRLFNLVVAASCDVQRFPCLCHRSCQEALLLIAMRQAAGQSDIGISPFEKRAAAC